MRYTAITWDVIPPPAEAFTLCCFYHSAYAYYEYLLIEETPPYEVIANNRSLIGLVVFVDECRVGDILITAKHS